MPVWAMITSCVVCFVLGIVAMYVFLWYSIAHDNKKRKRRPASRSENPKATTDGVSQTEVKTKKKIGTMNLILIIIGVALLAFTIYMIKLFREYGAVPDTLVTCVFAALGGECGIMGWIKTTKDRKQERKWELEDRKNDQNRE